MSNIAPGVALRQVNEEYARERMQQADRTVRSPEMHALAKHWKKMADKDLERAARLDPRQHLHGCRCLVCDDEPKACPVDGCGVTVRGATRLAGHLARHRRAARSATALLKRRERLAGQSFLEALLSDPQRAAAIDLRALRAFEDRLRESSGGRRQRRTAHTRLALEEILRAAPTDTFTAHGTLARDHAAIVHRLALLAALSPRAVASALLVWGLEKFAADMKAGGIAREAHVPKTLTDPQPARRAALIAGDEDEA